MCSSATVLIPPFSAFSSSEDESESEPGGLDDSVCPAGCDLELFDQAVALREKRLDLEEALMEEKRGVDGAKRELEGMKKKAKTMDAHVKTALTELQVRHSTDFQYG